MQAKRDCDGGEEEADARHGRQLIIDEGGGVPGRGTRFVGVFLQKAIIYPLVNEAGKYLLFSQFNLSCRNNNGCDRSRCR